MAAISTLGATGTSSGAVFGRTSGGGTRKHLNRRRFYLRNSRRRNFSYRRRFVIFGRRSFHQSNEMIVVGRLVQHSQVQYGCPSQHKQGDPLHAHGEYELFPGRTPFGKQTETERSDISDIVSDPVGGFLIVM